MSKNLDIFAAKLYIHQDIVFKFPVDKINYLREFGN